MGKKTLPPDPSRHNWDGAIRADKALLAFTGMKHAEDFQVRDLLTALMHWCDRNKDDFGEELAAAGENYTRETTAEEEHA